MDEPLKRALAVIDGVMQGSTVPMTIADAVAEDMPIILANPAFEALTGYGVDETVGRNCRFLQTAATKPESVAAIRHGITSATEVSVDIHNRRKDGSEFINNLFIFPLFAANDRKSPRFFIGSQFELHRENDRNGSTDHKRAYRFFAEEAAEALTRTSRDSQRHLKATAQQLAISMKLIVQTKLLSL